MDVSRRRHVLLAAGCAGLTAVAAIAVVLVFTGSSRAAPTKDEYLQQVAAICRVYGPRLDTIRPPDVAEPANVIAALRLVLPLIRAQEREVRALRPPAGLESQVTRWLDQQRRRLRLLERALRAGQRQDFRAMSTDYIAFALAGSKTGRLGSAIGIPHPPC